MTYRHEIRMVLLAVAILGGAALEHGEHIQLADCLLCAVTAVF